MSNQESDEEKKFSLSTFGLNALWLIFSILGIGVFCYYMYELNKEFDPFIEGQVDIEKTAQVGDFIGGLVGALWAFAGIILFYLALKLQKDELKLSREVLKDSVKTQKETQAVMEKQLNSLKYNSDLETLNYLILSHTETISDYNKKGLLTREEDVNREKLIQEKQKAREILLRMAKELMSKEYLD